MRYGHVNGVLNSAPSEPAQAAIRVGTFQYLYETILEAKCKIVADFSMQPQGKKHPTWTDDVSGKVLLH